MKKSLAPVLAAVICIVVHEGAHVLAAAACGEFETLRMKFMFFPEVIFRTPVDERAGIQWAFISGASNVATLALGYSLLMLGRKFSRIPNMPLKASLYYLTIYSLLMDALNLSIGPFVYGGDAVGIALGLGASRYLIQAVFLLVLLVNRELLARKLLPAYAVHTEHPLLRPWTRLAR